MNPSGPLATPHGQVLVLIADFLPAPCNYCPVNFKMPLKTNGLPAALQMLSPPERRCWAEDPFKEGILGWARSASPSFFFFPVTRFPSGAV